VATSAEVKQPSFWLRGALIAIAYFAIGRLSMLPIIAQGPISTIWAPAGIALGALLICGPRFWPAVALGSLAVAVTTGVPFSGALLIAGGNTLEVLLGSLLVRRVRATRRSEGAGTVRDALAIGFLGGALAAAVSALLGVAAITAVGLEAPSEAWHRRVRKPVTGARCCPAASA
jgi:integral membrane sensor domain MASE1